MNYYEPRQKQNAETGEILGWHYTVANRRTGTHAVGYCTEHPPHATEQEARECYTKWILDNRVSHHLDKSTQRKCQKCSEWTGWFTTIGDFRLITLCEKDQTNEIIAEFLGTVGNIMSS